MLSLQGVPLATQRKVAAYTSRYANQASDEETYKRIYFEYMEQFGADDLPEDLRPETESLLAAGRAYPEEKRAALRAAYERWRQADPLGKIDLLREFQGDFIKRFGVPRAHIEYETEERGGAFAKIDVREALRREEPLWLVHVNKADPLFEDNSLEGFALALSSLPHELNHLRQCRFLREDRVPGHKPLVNPSSLAINAAGGISSQTNQWAYIAQPLELQSHLLQDELSKGILQAIK